MTWAEVALVAVATFLMTVVFTKPLIGWLAARQLGKVIRTDGPDHRAKAGTPTMGGLGMLAAIAIGIAYVAFRANALGQSLVPSALLLAYLALFGAIGLLDDWAGLARKGRARELGVGFGARRMILLQAIAAVVPLVFVATTSSRSFGGRVLLTGTWVLVMLGTVNGVNLSDGLDGLAAGLCVAAFT
jgi:phospho-N-acetylmuramoyl-pentapeptide-transferase